MKYYHNLFLIIAIIIILTSFSCSVTNSGSSGSGGGGGGSSNADTSNPNDPVDTEDTIDGLVNDFDFDGNDGLEVNGAEITEGINDNAYSFDGYDDYLLLPDDESLNLSTGGSIEVLIKADTYKTWAGVVHKGEKKDFSDEAYSLQFWGSGKKIAIYLLNEELDNLLLQSSSKLDLDTWYHIVATWDSENVKIYINGELDNSMENTIGEVRNTDGGLVIGAQLSEKYNNSFGNVGFDGTIDLVRIYNRALLDTEISDNYNDIGL